MTGLRLSDTDRVARLAVIPACVFLFVLPITHTVAIRTIALGLLILCSGYVWWRERLPLPARSLLIAMGVWAGVAVASLLWSVDFVYSQGEVRNEVIYPLVAFFSFYSLTRNEGQWRVWIRVLVASAAVIAAYFFVNYWQHGFWYTHVRTYVGDRNAYSTYAVLVAPVLLAAVLDRGFGTRWRVSAGVALALTLGAGVLTGNRIMWVALVLAALVLLATRLRRRATSGRARAAALAGVLAIGVAGAVQIAMVSGQKTLAPGGGTLAAQLEADPRVKIWTYAVERIAERPWLGHGYGRGILGKDFVARFQGNILNWHGHNMFLNAAIGGGIVLAATLVAVFAALAVALARGSQASAPCAFVLAVLVAAIVKSLTDDVLIRETSLLLWSLAGMALGVAAGRRPERDAV